VKIVVQQVASGRFLKRSAIWVGRPEDARVFPNAASAINYCVVLGIRGIQLAVFSDDDWDFEGCLRPFGGPEVREESRNLQKTNRELRGQQQALMRDLANIQTEDKERKKQIPFVRKN